MTAQSSKLKQALLRRLVRAGHPIGKLMVSQAQRRIANGGDSQHRYPDLWATTSGLPSYRAGGQPLMDTGHLSQSLFHTVELDGDKVSVQLHANESHRKAAHMHQHGGKTRGPNFIPLTRNAVRTHQLGANPEEEGLTRGVDYIMAWSGVTVPQRKIGNFPPEDMSEITDALNSLMRSA